MIEINKIYCEDNVAFMRGNLDTESIDLTVTSPPYDNLRTYNGYSFDFEGVANQLYRVTKTGGVVVWVVGDSTINGSESGTSFRQALYFKEIGFNLHDTMIYQKQNYVPLTHNRYEQAFEYMFVFSKGKPKTFNPLLVSTKRSGEKKNPYKTCESQTQDSSMRHREKAYIINKTKIKSNIFIYGVGKNMSSKDPLAFKHPAIFPESLARDHILSWSNPGDIVLDPFSGSGTTPVVAYQNQRQYIGIDISQEYCDIANQRLKQTSLFSHI